MKQMIKLTLAVILAILVAAGFSGAAPQNSSGNSGKPVIILVHGAFVDATSWQYVIPILQNDGYKVIGVQLPLLSLSGDIATAKRVIDAQAGPVVVVGHSYGGAVITGAAAGSPNVKALVYIAAYAPDAGETITTLNDKYAPPQIRTALVLDSAGFLTIDPAKFRDIFAGDVPVSEARVLAVTQKPAAVGDFSETVPAVAWKTIPSWYLVAKDDRAIDPDLERYMARRMGAKTSEVKSSHVPFISHPRTVAKLIETAATAPVR